ncbi:cation diffusion facilitator family transporter [Roseibium algae]|uniref:Cation diffusion facilitator family transporter n=1 Tax=Roseibium algae TaxID=3123038 RepID=A0ABU8TK62_9HYPH
MPDPENPDTVLSSGHKRADHEGTGHKAHEHASGHAHGHDDSHRHDHGHSHAPDVNDKNARAVAAAGLLIASFMFAELVGGYLSGSLALMADAVHMVTDAASLGLAWWAFQQVKKPATPALSYGRHRLPVLMAFANAIFLLIVTGWICIEAVERFLKPEKVLAGPMLIIAVIGLLVNIAAFMVLRRGADNSLNIRSAVLHVIGDMLGSVAAIIAALVIAFTGWYPIDPILSIFVALLIVRSAIAILSQSSHILLEGSPVEIDRQDLIADLVRDVPDLEAISHMHIWSLAEGHLNATLHARPSRPEAAERVTKALRDSLNQRGIGHVTIEIDHQ